ncbi:hypothetical protein F3J09_21055 [Bacillus sp. Ab-1751]|uniref:hypothetical protein n=1 Tax=Bacillus sp. Ab-1751 TaxID=2608326 RepID=UPI000534F998|nr:MULTISPECIES: hypothetical protein [Bacillus cereus group]NIE93214.1 hypothetical protein [Bacillus sp. Ab-1751]NRQ72226.1 hypothetical protein [Bacillus cereus]WIG15597.1 hypothetical protein QOM09_28430 [Bacillus thuringiensis]WMW41315.1 hypothetical protein RE433_27220 [Bacillus cereus]
MIEVILSFFLLATYSIRYLFSTGENRKQAKADLKEFWASNEEQGLFGAAVGLVISIIIFGYLLTTQINF